MLPESIYDFIEAEAKRSMATKEMYLPGVLANLAGIIGRKAEVQPQPLDPGFVKVPNVWGLTISEPWHVRPGEPERSYPPCRVRAPLMGLPTSTRIPHQVTRVPRITKPTASPVPMRR